MIEILYVDSLPVLASCTDDETTCYGQCNGTGVIPVRENHFDPELRHRWCEAHKDCNLRTALKSLFQYPQLWYWKSVIKDFFRGRVCDGTHFVPCHSCNGSGKRPQINPH